MNKRAVGHAFQDWICKWLNKNFPGITLHNFKSTCRYLPHLGRWTSPQSNDLWGVVDIAAIGPDACTDKPLMIQATTGKNVSTKEKDMMSVPWNVDHFTVEIWHKVGPREIDIRRLVKCADGLCFVKWAKIVNGKYEQIRESNPAHLS